MKKIFDKNGPATMVWEVPMYLLMGRAPEDMTASALQKIRYLFQSYKYNYPPLAFAETPELVDVFRGTVRKLMEVRNRQKGDDGAKGAQGLDRLNKMDKFRKDGSKRAELWTEFRAFWKEQSEYLVPRLNTVRDRTIPDNCNKEPVFQQYYSRIQDFYGNPDFREKPNKDELGEDAYYAHHSPVPIEIAGRWLKLGPQRGEIQRDSMKAWIGIETMIKDIPNLRTDESKPADDPVNREYQEKIFHEYGAKLVDAIRERIPTVDIKDQQYVIKLVEMGYSPKLFEHDGKLVNLIGKCVKGEGKDGWLPNDLRGDYNKLLEATGKKERRTTEQVVQSVKERAARAREAEQKTSANTNTPSNVVDSGSRRKMGEKVDTSKEQTVTPPVTHVNPRRKQQKRGASMNTEGE